MRIIQRIKVVGKNRNHDVNLVERINYKYRFRKREKSLTYQRLHPLHRSRQSIDQVLVLSLKN